MILFLISLTFENFCTYMYSEQSIFSIEIFFLKEACKMKYILNGDAYIFGDEKMVLCNLMDCGHLDFTGFFSHWVFYFIIFSTTFAIN